MTGAGGEVSRLHSINASLENLYTLDPHDIDDNTNDAERKRMRKYLDAVMEIALTKRQRQIVMMYHGEGKKTPEIAAELGISPRVVQRILRVSMKKLHQYKKIFLKAT